MSKILNFKVAVAMAMALALPSVAQAESTLDKVIKAKVLRCGAILDFPPFGYRTSENEPDGFDVAYCKDMAKALGVEVEIVETPQPDRIPALVSDRVDVVIAGTTNTTERGISVAFSQPYMAATVSVLTRKNSGVNAFEDLKGHPLAGVVGTTTEQFLIKQLAIWNDPNTTYTAYASDAEAYLALQQGKVDGYLTPTANAATLIKTGSFPDFTIAGLAPMPADLVSIAVKRNDFEFLNWTRLFVWNQVNSGRFKQLYNKYVADGDAPNLTVPGVEY